MSDAQRPANKPRSVAMAAEKARVERLIRLKTILDKKLDNAVPVIDALLGELAEGGQHPTLWEALHAAAARDHKEANLTEAYQKSIVGARMKKLPPQSQAEVLMHAADCMMGVVGDPAAAEDYLWKVIKVVPGHLEAFTRLERRLEQQLDTRRLLDLYATVAAAPPKPAAVLATQVFNRVLQLPPKEPLSEETCRALLVLVPTNPRVVDALETHCKATKRLPLAGALVEHAIGMLPLAEDQDLVFQWRLRLLDLYTSDPSMADRAMPHVEEILKRDPTNANAFKTAEKLLSSRGVGSRAAAVLRDARRAR